LNLTKKEQALLESVTEGMDQPYCGWLHELAPCDWTNRSAAGVLSSLIRKGLVTSHEEPGEGGNKCYWIELVAPQGWEAVETSVVPEDSYGA
jgi:hypothetical protein